jgi:hypothetical protein
MVRATLIASMDEPGEVRAMEAWFEQWRPRLSYVSENTGCGCCVHIYDVAGPADVIGTIPEALIRSFAREPAPEADGYRPHEKLPTAFFFSPV